MEGMTTTGPSGQPRRNSAWKARTFEAPGELSGIATLYKEDAVADRKAIVDGPVAMAVEEIGCDSAGSYALDLLTDTTSL
jgi:hypothetical protein